VASAFQELFTVEYTSSVLAVVFIRIIPFAGVPGRWAVVPTGSVTAPVVLNVVFWSVPTVTAVVPFV
jgi:hypothetical protein